MTADREERAVRFDYGIPEELEGPGESDPAAMRTAFSEDVDRVLEQHRSDAELVALQGEVSSMKTWQLIATAEALLDLGRTVTVLAPQRVNRRELAGRLSAFGVPYVEHPGRLDLCAWDPWRESVGRVDERTCSSNGCPLYPGDRDLGRLAEEALEKHRLEAGGEVRLDEEAAKKLAAGFDQPVCPHYLLEAMSDLVGADGTARVATYAKAFEDDDAGSKLDAEVGLLDESHTVAASTDRAYLGVDISDVAAAAMAVRIHLSDNADKASRELAADLAPLAEALSDLERASRKRAVGPEDLFRDSAVSLDSSFESLRRARELLVSRLGRSVETGRADRTDVLSRIYNRLGEVTAFLSRIKSHRQGDLDFVHTRYEARGEAVNRLEFRRVSDRRAASTPWEVYESWCEHGTHPAIADRWGGLLDYYIEAVWSGRSVSPGGGRSKEAAPPTPLGELESITGASTLVGYSATHNEASDPARPVHARRSTAHRLAIAPLQLRAEGDERADYHGRSSVDPTTPWFRGLVESAREETGGRLAAVPINRTNAAKWEGMPVEVLELPDGRGGSAPRPGLVPNSRAAIGDKGLEDMDVDAVLSGVQVQGPADTARRLVELWELLAPDHDDLVEALERSWRLLAQHVVSGTIQAAGRFRRDATVVVFERADLIDLAGFEWERLSPSMDGFPGAFARSFGELHSGWQRRRRAVDAERVVRYLEENPTKAPTRPQFTSKYCRAFDATEREATAAVEAAVRAGRVGYVSGTLRTVSDGSADQAASVSSPSVIHSLHDNTRADDGG